LLQHEPGMWTNSRGLPLVGGRDFSDAPPVIATRSAPTILINKTYFMINKI
jgi:hypothetical protein